MKLIDLLVKELPSRGGWPEDINFITQDGRDAAAGGNVVSGWKKSPDLRAVGKLKSYWISAEENGGYGLIITRGSESCEDYDSAIVTREQYEAALKPAWNGEGLPPVGTLCRYRSFTDAPWVECKVIAYHESDAWLQRIPDGKTFILGNPELHPALTEAEFHREKVIAAMREACTNYNKTDVIHAVEQVYDSIVAHKITGVTLVPTVSQIVRATEKCSREDAERIVALLTTGTITE